MKKRTDVAAMQHDAVAMRRVWAAVTRTPCATVRQLGAQIGMPYGSVSVALRLLRDAGYVHFEDRAGRARTVIVPFVVME
jgi:DNA-binding transcriptional ArsR family regulator